MLKIVSEFLLGIDLSYIDIANNDFSFAFENMTKLQWLKMKSTGIQNIPKEIEKLTQLKRLSISKNQIKNLSGNWWLNLKCLRFFNARKNFINNESIPEGFFTNFHLEVVDLSYNLLTEIPKGILETKSLTVLNLSNNKITSVPKILFENCLNLTLLDLSNNQLITFPNNLSSQSNLQSLNLNNNSLRLDELRLISELTKLTSLYLSNTLMKLENFPSDIDKLPFLSDLDISNNNLKKVPETVYKISSLTKLNLSGNDFDELCDIVDCWPNLITFNLSRNNLSVLPSFITRLSTLKILFLDHNQLKSNGIPHDVEKLSNLELFSASENLLENIPEGLCRCSQLKELNLNSNQLVTLPVAVHELIKSLNTFSVENNPNLKMPLKLDDKKDKYKYYEIDFSLETQMELARESAMRVANSNITKKDTASRIRRLRRQKYDNSLNDDEMDPNSKCVLEGMKKVSRDKNLIIQECKSNEDKFISSKKWKDAIAKPNLDYSRLFDDDVGNLAGIEIWEINEFYPRRIQEDLMFGSFCKGDCYIILQTTIDEKTGSQLHWSIYYWIGSNATLDKVTCAAIHAVHLRNHLGAECRCERLEENKESDEFKAIFNGQIEYIEGAHGESGFFKLEEKIHRKKLYRLFGGDKNISVFSCNTHPSLLDSKFVYIFDEHFSRLYLWIGKSSRLMLQSKGRLLADKINQRERRGQSEIIIELEGKESTDFKKSLGDNEDILGDNWCSFSRDHIPLNWIAPSPILYDIELGNGFIEMPQVKLQCGRLKKSMLQMKHVYIMESSGDIYVWVGNLAPKFLKFAGLKLAYEMIEFLPGQSKRSPIMCCQSVEPLIFKMQFCDWEDSMIDFIRSEGSLRERRVDINGIMEKDNLKIDMLSFFMPRENPISWDEAKTIMKEFNDDIFINENNPFIKNPYNIKQFVFNNREWEPVEERWMGHFFCKDCYIIHVEYWETLEEEEEEEDNNENLNTQNRIQTVIYFWQGREASDIPWLQFNFSLKKEMEIRFSGINDKNFSKENLQKVEFKRMFQQQETPQFLAHFQHIFVVHLGKYQDRYSDKRKKRVEMFYLRENGNALCTRTIEVKPLIEFLNSCFQYILKIPALLANSDKDQVLCFIGKNSNRHYDDLLETIANDTYKPDDNVSIFLVLEGQEPEIFWNVLGGKGSYDNESMFMHFSRLFRLSNELGFFCATEKCTDFCQDDLADEDIMLLDTGSQIYLWFGNRASDIEKKLSLKAAKLYKEHMNRVQPNQKRQLKVTLKKKEPHLFRRCFHGWGPFKEAKE